jgi:hypothetical protein
MGLRKPKLQVGKRFATGTGTTDTAGVLNVTGLDFTPSVIVTIQGSINYPYVALHVKDFTSAYQYVSRIGTFSEFRSFSTHSNGFTINCSGNVQLTNVTWYAYE